VCSWAILPPLLVGIREGNVDNATKTKEGPASLPQWRRPLPEPSKWLRATMILEGESKVYLKLSGKWLILARSYSKLRRCNPRALTLRPAFLVATRPSRPGTRKANLASVPNAVSKLFYHATKWQNRQPSVSHAVRSAFPARKSPAPASSRLFLLF